MSSVTDKQLTPLGTGALPRRANTVLESKDYILEQIQSGTKLQTIAESLGLTSHSTIAKYLASDPDYQLAREFGLESRMDIRESELESAQDSVTVARARELLSHARWRAERECPKRWGAKQEITQTNYNVDISDLLKKRDERIASIAGEAKVIEDGEG